MVRELGSERRETVDCAVYKFGYMLETLESPRRQLQDSRISHYYAILVYMNSDNVLSADNQQERPKIQPWYVAGFVDGEGTFHIAINKSKENRFGLRFIPEFHINQNSPSKDVLEDIMSLFGCGYIKQNHKTSIRDKTWVYVVRNRNDLLNIIIPFFDAHPLRTQKQKDFLLFKRVASMMSGNEHHKKNGIKKIISLAYNMNQAGRYRKVSKQHIIELLESSETIRQTRCE